MKNRSVIEIVALTLTFVGAFAVIATGALVAIIEIRDPTADTGEMANSLLAIIAGIFGALFGLLAGKSSVGSDLDQRPQSVYRPPEPGNIVPTWKNGEEEQGER